MNDDGVTVTAAVGPHSPLRFLPSALRIPEHPLRAIAVGWLTAFPVSMVFALAGAMILPHAQQPQFAAAGPAALFALVIVSPVIETLMMGGVLLVLVRLVPGWLAVLFSAIGWGLVHSSLVPIWGLVIWWPFLVFSTLFVTWERRSLLLAFAIPMSVHALQNLIPGLIVAYGAPA